MSDDDAQELFEARAAALNDVVAEAVREYLAGQGRDGDTGALALEDVAEVLKVGVAAAHARGAELERGDVGAADNLVVGVHAAAHAVGSGVADLRGGGGLSDCELGPLLVGACDNGRVGGLLRGGKEGIGEGLS